MQRKNEIQAECSLGLTASEECTKYIHRDSFNTAFSFPLPLSFLQKTLRASDVLKLRLYNITILNVLHITYINPSRIRHRWMLKKNKINVSCLSQMFMSLLRTHLIKIPYWLQPSVPSPLKSNNSSWDLLFVLEVIMCFVMTSYS